jgi:hypothetical protein
VEWLKVLALSSSPSTTKQKQKKERKKINIIAQIMEKDPSLYNLFWEGINIFKMI